MPEARDGLGRTITLERPARRVVSLVPSLTEAVARFGRAETLVGCTRFCLEPPDVVDALRKVGGTKDPEIEAVVALEPDLVLANKEENTREAVEALRSAGLRVFVGDARTVAGALDELGAIGSLAGWPRMRALDELRSEVQRQEELNGARPPVPVFCPIWRNPYMAVGADTYAHDMLRLAGGDNVFATHPSGSRYPQVTVREIEAADPAVILLPDEPFRFRERHREELLALRSVAAARDGHVYLLDGRALTWYGPRIGEGLRTIAGLLDRARPGWTPPVGAAPEAGPEPAGRAGRTSRGRTRGRGRPAARDQGSELPPGLRLQVTRQDVVEDQE